MKAAIIAGCVVLSVLSASRAHAASIQVEISADRSRSQLLIIKGDILNGDYDKFKRIANRLPYGTVIVLNSRGGLLVDGLNIGTTIKAKGFRTFAYDYCMSVCAMMWLAGWERSTTSDTSIGFHGAG
jgi:hypothetical protein